jgi:hypothetical protein
MGLKAQEIERLGFPSLLRLPAKPLVFGVGRGGRILYMGFSMALRRLTVLSRCAVPRLILCLWQAWPDLTPA